MYKVISSINDEYEIIDYDMLNRINYLSKINTASIKNYDKIIKRNLHGEMYKYLNIIWHFKQNYNNLMEQYDICYSFGGGLPKLESYFLINKTFVYDDNIEVYKPFINEFKDIYNYNKEFEFIQEIVTPEIIKNLPIDSNKKTLFTFFECLNNFTLNDHLKILKNLPKNVDVIIYNPDVTFAKDKNWFYFNHNINNRNSFIPIIKLKKILIYFEYKIKMISIHENNLYILFTT